MAIPRYATLRAVKIDDSAVAYGSKLSYASVVVVLLRVNQSVCPSVHPSHTLVSLLYQQEA